MATFSFDQSGGQFDERFVVLGPEWSKLNARKRNRINRKILRDSSRKTKFAWGTLGWADPDKKGFDPKGTLEFSAEGRKKDATGATLEEIKTIYEFNDQLGGSNKVTERYINFDKVDFGFKKSKFTVDQLPELRLTLFLNKGEGAIVFYQYCNREEWKDEDDEILYILPEATDKNHSTDRDRLDYLFPIMPGNVGQDSSDPRKLVPKGGKSDTSFVVKILTFKRRIKSAQQLYDEGLKKLNSLPGDVMYHLVGKKKYKLIKFNASTGKFDEVTQSSQVDKNAHTLMFVHGTFKSVGETYSDLITHKKGKLLKDLLKNKVFDQILGFDHPTISHDVFQNSEWLYNKLGPVKFTQPLSLIGTSRGGLLTRWLASDTKNKSFKVEEIINFSTANGVDYFTFGKKVNVLLKVLKRSGGPVARVITMIAQFSVQFFLKQPGCLQMTPGQTRLKRVLNTKPKNLRYKAMAADWDKSLTDKWRKRVLHIILDATIKLILGKKNDWVVNTGNQRISPPNSLKPCEITSMHTSNYKPGYPKLNGKKLDTHKYIYDYFAQNSLPC